MPVLHPGAYLGGGLCHGPLLTLPLSKNKQMVASDCNIPDSFDGFCGLWPGADPGG